MQRTIRMEMSQLEAAFPFQKAVLYHDDCFAWIERQPGCSILLIL